MIKIIAGTVGVKQNGRIISYTAADGAVDLKDPEREARLVKKGVAVYIDDGGATSDDMPPGGGAPEGIPQGSGTPDDMPPGGGAPADAPPNSTTTKGNKKNERV